MKKRILAVILLVSICLTGLAACSSGNGRSEAISAETYTGRVGQADPAATTEAPATEALTTAAPATTPKQEDAEQETDSASPSTTEKKTHTEYVKTITIYAEKGAVVTWYDPSTGQFTYKCKCETCGTLSGEHTGHKMSADGSSLNEGFSCTNSKCSMWGKSQRAIIKCSVFGEYVEVDD